MVAAATFFAASRSSCFPVAQHVGTSTRICPVAKTPRHTRWHPRTQSEARHSNLKRAPSRFRPFAFRGLLSARRPPAGNTIATEVRRPSGEDIAFDNAPTQNWTNRLATNPVSLDLQSHRKAGPVEAPRAFSSAQETSAMLGIEHNESIIQKRNACA